MLASAQVPVAGSCRRRGVNSVQPIPSGHFVEPFAILGLLVRRLTGSYGVLLSTDWTRVGGHPTDRAASIERLSSPGGGSRCVTDCVTTATTAGRQLWTSRDCFRSSAPHRPSPASGLIGKKSAGPRTRQFGRRARRCQDDSASMIVSGQGPVGSLIRGPSGIPPSERRS